MPNPPQLTIDVGEAPILERQLDVVASACQRHSMRSRSGTSSTCVMTMRP